MSRKIKYYGVAGENAYGVYTDYEKVQDSQRYIKKYRVKGFATFQEAKTFAVDTFSELQEDFHWNYSIEEIEALNWLYYKKQVKKQYS